MFFWPKSTLRLQGILLAVGVSFKSYYLCFNIHTYTHNPNLCFLLFSQWLHVAGGLRLWNSLEISVRKVFLLHLWLNSPQELQVSLCLLGQEEALTWGGFEPGKQRDRQDRAPCIHSYMCSEHFFFFQMSFANVIWASWEIAASWRESVAHLGIAKLLGGEVGVGD